MTAPSPIDSLQPPRPLRADARRNYERLLRTARETFDEFGPETCLDEIARRAEVGIGTLYRHFPTRHVLLEAVLHNGIADLCRQAEHLLDASEPGEALATWLRAVVAHAVASRGLTAELMCTANETACQSSTPCDAMRALGGRLLARAQESGEVRDDIGTDDLFDLVNGIAWATERSGRDSASAERLLALMLDGLRRG